MRVYLTRRNSEIKAIGEYNKDTKGLTVLKGSVVSSKIAYSEKFKGSATIEKYREQYTKDCVVTQDVQFKSSSTAANFFTGSSTNGLVAWKDENGTKLKDVICCEL